MALAMRKHRAHRGQGHPLGLLHHDADFHLVGVAQTGGRGVLPFEHGFDPLLFHAQGRHLGEGAGLDAQQARAQPGFTTPMGEGGLRLCGQGGRVFGQQIGHDFELAGVTQVEDGGAHGNRSFAVAVQFEHAPCHRGVHAPQGTVTRGGGLRQADAQAPQVVRGAVEFLFGHGQFLAALLQSQLGTLLLGRGDKALAGQ